MKDKGNVRPSGRVCFIHLKDASAPISVSGKKPHISSRQIDNAYPE